MVIYVVYKKSNLGTDLMNNSYYYYFPLCELSIMFFVKKITLYRNTKEAG